MQTLNSQKDFPIFAREPGLVYLDSAATALKPLPVIEAVREYYENYPVNIRRGFYNLSTKATEKYEAARDKVARFINAGKEEVIFTSGTTDGLNLLANILTKDLKHGDGIVLTRMEHHANLIPWQQAAKRTGAKLNFIELDADWQLDLNSARALMDENTKIASFAHISNVLGTITPVRQLVALAHSVGALAIVDAAQTVAHMPLDVKEWDADFIVFSGHKLYGPTGVGVLYGKRENLKLCEPGFFGGEMIESVTYEAAEWAGLPSKYEAGTPAIASAIGLGAAVDYIQSIGWDNIIAHEKRLTEYALQQLRLEARIIGKETAVNRVGVISFLVSDAHPHDTADIFNSLNVAVRAGHHCAMPLMSHLGLPGTVRASLGLYNTEADIDRLVAAAGQVKKILRTQTPPSFENVAEVAAQKRSGQVAQTADETVYKELILELLRSPLNWGELADYDFTAEDFNGSCGDIIRLYVKYDASGHIAGISHTGYGCAISRAAVSLLTEDAKNKTNGQISRLTAADMVEMLGIPVGDSRLPCATLGLNVLQKITAAGEAVSVNGPRVLT